MRSAAYRQLLKQIRLLRHVFLPALIEKNPEDPSTKEDSLKALAFRILSHADIEHFLEQRCLELAAAADAAWDTSRTASVVTLCLLGFSGLTFAKAPESIQPPPKKKQTAWSERTDPDHRVRQSITAFTRYVLKENHGIKEDSLLALVLPVGINASKIDSDLVLSLNDLGSKRGEAAHTSSAAGVQQRLNPRDECTNVLRTVRLLGDLDKEFNRLKTIANGPSVAQRVAASGDDPAPLGDGGSRATSSTDDEELAAALAGEGGGAETQVESISSLEISDTASEEVESSSGLGAPMKTRSQPEEEGEP